MKMLEPIRHILASKRIVLASASPRRQEILRNVGLKFEVIPSTFEENLEKSKFPSPHEYVTETARNKALEVAMRLQKEQGLPDLIIGADTVVTMDGKIFEKPSSKQHAFEMLTGFSGKSHTVYSGVILITKNEDSSLGDVAREDAFKVTRFYAATQVTFASLSPSTIWGYIETGEPMDKAGGYGIQEKGGTLIEGIKGDYFNVMGFPLHLFCTELVKLYQNS